MKTTILMLLLTAVNLFSKSLPSTGVRSDTGFLRVETWTLNSVTGKWTQNSIEKVVLAGNIGRRVRIFNQGKKAIWEVNELTRVSEYSNKFYSHHTMVIEVPNRAYGPSVQSCVTNYNYTVKLIDAPLPAFGATEHRYGDYKFVVLSSINGSLYNNSGAEVGWRVRKNDWFGLAQWDEIELSDGLILSVGNDYKHPRTGMSVLMAEWVW